jgi:hypothetical protein
MAKWFRLHEYASTKINGYITENTPPVYIDGLKHMAWGYIKSEIIKKLNNNQAYSIKNLRLKYKYYILKH